MSRPLWIFGNNQNPVTIEIQQNLNINQSLPHFSWKTRIFKIAVTGVDRQSGAASKIPIEVVAGVADLLINR